MIAFDLRFHQFNLAWKLALALKSHASPALLNSYESERLPVIAEMLNITTELSKELEYKSETRRGIKAAQAQAAQKDKDEEKLYKRDWKLFQLDVNYRWSEIVFDERFTTEAGNDRVERHAYGMAGRDIRAGDRAPDAPALISIVDNASRTLSVRLFDVFKPTAHTALIFTSDPSGASVSNLLAPFSKVPKEFFQFALVIPSGTEGNVESVLAGVSHTFIDSEGHAYSGYGLRPSEEEMWVVIVRPDGMIGAFAKSTEGLEKYLSLVFS